MNQRPDLPMTEASARPAGGRAINRRSMLKGVGGIAALTAVGAGGSLAASAPAQAAGLSVVEHSDGGRMQYYRFSTPSIGWNPAVNVLLPDGYNASRRYPVLYLLHGGGLNADFRAFDNEGIRDVTAGRELIVVMPDGGKAGWYSNPVSSNVGPRNWETFHMSELIPWVDATFSTIAEFSGRAVSGFSMGGFGALKYTAKYYGHFASVSSHSGPADLRGPDGGMVTHWANLSSSLAELGGGMVYGAPWDQARVSADNPMENIERYRGKRIFLVSGTTFFDLNEKHVLPTQRTFGGALEAAGIPHERYEESGGHFVRRERLQQDIDGVIAHLTKAG
ncbi:alpha/beta hydrolase-fold protein [uncultured Actinomyces sp.]|uniref:alpha/beta hydrolase n=1 Tax=uncultured Actinomyces sp. TaxID=249061 RepID=UPI0028D81153|nr:alpha/beta hydrolase-fold protein [uncultured Actinomyces sp.]